MFVKLTEMPKKTELFLRVENVQTVCRDPNNLLQTIVSVNIMTPKGPMGYLVSESPDTIITQLLAGGFNKVGS